MKTKQIHIVLSLVLAVIVLIGGIGVNIVHYCCHACEQDGIEAVLGQKCEQEHQNERFCCSSERHSDGDVCSSSSVGAEEHCSLAYFRFSVENELNNLSHNQVLSVYLLPVISLFKLNEQPRAHTFPVYTAAYNSRHLLSLFSVLLI